MTCNRPCVDDRRRSRRMYCAVPVLLQNLAPETAFAVRAVVVESSAHGCVVRSPRPFMAGLTLSLYALSGRRLAAGRVVRSIPNEGGEWNVAVELDGASRLTGLVLHRRPAQSMPTLQPLPA